MHDSPQHGYQCIQWYTVVKGRHSYTFWIPWTYPYMLGAPSILVTNFLVKLLTKSPILNNQISCFKSPKCAVWFTYDKDFQPAIANELYSTFWRLETAKLVIWNGLFGWWHNQKKWWLEWTAHLRKNEKFMSSYELKMQLKHRLVKGLARNTNVIQNTQIKINSKIPTKLPKLWRKGGFYAHFIRLAVF